MSEGSGNVRAGFRRGQLSDEVAGYVRELIMSGNLRPGEFVRQERIADELELSATPVRGQRRGPTERPRTGSPGQRRYAMLDVCRRQQ
jgi:hypothetical protein